MIKKCINYYLKVQGLWKLVIFIFKSGMYLEIIAITPSILAQPINFIHLRFSQDYILLPSKGCLFFYLLYTCTSWDLRFSHTFDFYYVRIWCPKPGTPKLQEKIYNIYIEQIQNIVTWNSQLSTAPQKNHQSASEHYYKMPFPFQPRKAIQPLPFCLRWKNGLTLSSSCSS